MASRCSFQVPDSDFHAPARVHRSHQDSKSVPSLRPQVTPRAAHFAKGETFRISRFQKLASEQGAYLVGLAPNKISIRLLMIVLVYLVQEICCPISSFQLPASGARPERTFYFPASGEHLRLAILGLGGISNFRLRASSFGPVDVKRREFPGSRVHPAPHNERSYLAEPNPG